MQLKAKCLGQELEVNAEIPIDRSYLDTKTGQVVVIILATTVPLVLGITAYNLTKKVAV